jgi:hypothetical protein
MARKTIGELEDEIKQKDQRIEELRAEIDEQRELIQRLREHAEEYDQGIEAWCETFDMTMTEDGDWTWKPFWDEHWQTIDDYNALVRDWNKYLPKINGEPRNVGRPLAASKAQVKEVLWRHQTGESLRHIAEELSLAFRRCVPSLARSTALTAPPRNTGNAWSASRRGRLAKWKRQKRTGDALPKRVNAFLEQGRALIKEAKGLGRG